MKANSDKSKQNNKAAHRVLAGVLCGASVLSLVLSLVMPPDLAGHRQRHPDSFYR